MREVCVIGGSRYFGKRLIERLLAAGDRVTVVNRGSARPPAGAVHVIADRNDEAALAAALGDRVFDVVIDQVCYTPVQAAVARRVFAGRTGRYVMTSTIEVYAHLDADGPVPEDALDPVSVRVEPELPWDEDAFLDAHYGEGKQQAEAVFAAGTGSAGGFPYVSVRVGHVLGGTDDFTGRLAHYAERIRGGEPVAVTVPDHPSTYIHVEEIADFLLWAAGEAFTGPVNACSHGPLTTADICAAVQAVTGGEVVLRAAGDGEPASPFAFGTAYGMSNARAEELGFRFGRTADWLPKAVAETLSA
ncbi:NAD-dependent epimerase/dehydratase family protein [Streptomyces sp. NPDC051211]|uniref:NAD-dependent epimerase/dehydratase family protein n=1 Tax=Streptomyces sp. NPDC051211 TaxID=3154643 RepID=UPI00344E074E